MAITKEDFVDFFSKEENKGAFEEIAKSQGFETPDDIQGLKVKNQESQKKYQKIRDERDSLQKKLDTFDIDEYNELRDQKSKNSKDPGSDELNKIQRDLKKANMELENEKKSRSDIESFLNNTLKETALIKALNENGFDDKHKNLLTDAFSGKAKIEIDGGKRSVVILDGEGFGLPASEFFKNFANSDSGKGYLKEPVNKGGNSASFQGGENMATITRAEYNKNPDKYGQKSARGEIKIVD